MVRSIRYDDLRPASTFASRAAQGSSGKRDTKPELLLRKALWRAGLRGYRLDVRALPGKPDVIFPRARIAIFCDGDFWHGKDLDARVARLTRGHNPAYWVAKIRTNVARDLRNDSRLAEGGWYVMRFWESAIRRDADQIASLIRDAVIRRRAER